MVRRSRSKTLELNMMVKKRVNGKNEDIDEIKTLVDSRVRELLLCEPEAVKKEVFYMRLNQAKLGMTYVHDREVMKRINSGQMIRVINFITSNPKEREGYIRASMPEVHARLEG